MKIKYFLVLALSFLFLETMAQPVEVQYDYNAVGDCIFSAENNSKAPVYLHLNFADLQNTSFPETLPYVKRLTPGFNALFTLQRDLDADAPRFNYEVKSFRSNPMAKVDLKFPYLIPFAEGKQVAVFDVPDLAGFRGSEVPKSWSATGFIAKPGAQVCASRTGTITEVVGATRNDNPETWYNGWNYNLTLMQTDGTLICYRNVSDKQKKLAVGDKIFAGQVLGELAPGTNRVEVVIYHHSINTKGLLFVIPRFVVSEDKTEIVNSATKYSVVHPVSVRALEMSKREKKKILGKK